jgi:hypothetical protein
VPAAPPRRSSPLSNHLPPRHLFYRSAGFALRAARAARGESASTRARAPPTFDQDWRDAVELEAATLRSLDELERKMTAPPTP